ncbi:hypothetical protein GT348_08360 [Aristophania vespae]|uniref:Uncharacterized protein n=1 Tax=Aristophania vespae TaxID=2697033 RepID=A0A6P1NG52_9PROT|nr:hypothetical protein [Aristophania vespae]QHI96233.1 hypothetical protein GT348_08360 [Aristophania vespae]
MQLVGEVAGQISDALEDAGVPGFDGTDPTKNIGRIISEAAGTALISSITGGNVGAGAASSIAGNIATGIALDDIAKWAISVTGPDHEDLASSITNAGENIAGTAAGAAIGAIIDGNAGAVNGGSISSTIQQYNGVYEKLAEKAIKAAAKAARKAGHPKLGDAIEDSESTINEIVEEGEHQAGKAVDKAKDVIDDIVEAPKTKTEENPNPSDQVSQDSLNPSQQKTPREITNEEDVYTNPDGSLFGEDGSSKGIREIKNNDDAASEAENFVTKLIGKRKVQRIIQLPPIKGVSGGKTYIIDNKNAITYRPAGAAGKLTDKTTVNVDVNTESARALNNGEQLKFKFLQK